MPELRKLRKEIDETQFSRLSSWCYSLSKSCGGFCPAVHILFRRHLKACIEQHFLHCSSLHLPSAKWILARMAQADSHSPISESWLFGLLFHVLSALTDCFVELVAVDRCFFTLFEWYNIVSGQATVLGISPFLCTLYVTVPHQLQKKFKACFSEHV